MQVWQPATETEMAMRDALRLGDQEHYFRILGRIELLLPVSGGMTGPNGQPGWGTWTAEGRTHILAFTSLDALRICLAEHAGAHRAVAYRQLANEWPNHEWWLAVNPGLPIEAYLPPWFVTQVNRGDVRLPGRSLGARARMDHADALRARDAVSSRGRSAEAVGPQPAGNGRVLASDQFNEGQPDPSRLSRAADLRWGDVSRQLTGAAAPEPEAPPSLGRALAAQGRGRVVDAEVVDGSVTDTPLTEIAHSSSPSPRSVPAAASDPVSGSATAPWRTDPASPPASGPAGAPWRTDPASPPASGPAGAPWRTDPADDVRGGGQPGNRFGVSVRPGAVAPVPGSAVPGAGSPDEGASGPTPRTAGDTPDRSPRPAGVSPSPYPGGVPATSGSAQPGRTPLPASAKADLAEVWAEVADDPTPTAPVAGTGPLPLGTPASGAGSPPPAGNPFRAAAGHAPNPAQVPTPAPAGPLAQPGTPSTVRPGHGPTPGQPGPGGSRGSSNAPAGPPGPAAGGRSPGGFGSADSMAARERAIAREAALSRDWAAAAAAEPAPRAEATSFTGSAHPVNPTPTADAGTGAVPGRAPAPGADHPGARGAGDRAAASGAEHLGARGLADRDATVGADRLGARGAENRAATSGPPAGGGGPGGDTSTATGVPAASGPPPRSGEPDHATTDGALSAGLTAPGAGGATGTPDDVVRDRGDGDHGDGADGDRGDGDRDGVAGEAATAAGPAEVMPGRAPIAGFVPANQVEEDLLAAVEAGSTDRFLSTLLLAKVLLAGGADAAQLLRNPAAWGTHQIDGNGYVAVFTSPERLAEHGGDMSGATWVRFMRLIKVWPGEDVSFAVNPQTPIGATMPGDQIVALADWAAKAGLARDEPDEQAPVAAPKSEPAKARAVVMQKAVASSQVGYYLERGYDRVSGFVHRANEVSKLTSPEQLYQALGLGYSGSPFKPTDPDVYVLRWTAHCPSLYRIPFGGQSEAAMRAMEGWVIERGPFRGNGFAPSEGRDVIAEFKVDSVRLPQGAQLWRMTAAGVETLVALFDADGPRWVKVNGQ